MEIGVLDLFYKNYQSEDRIVMNQGSSRSGKTYSIIQMLIYRALTEKLHISIVRKDSTTARNSVLRDFKGIMVQWGKWESEGVFNKVVMEYQFNNGSFIEFIGANDEQKIRGSKRDILYINEANEVSWDSWSQLNMRTSGQVYLDFNPSITRLHWLYSKVKDLRDDVTFIHSTYKGNSFLEQAVVDEIELYKTTDPDKWRVYGLGEMGVSLSTVFPLAEKTDAIPIDAVPLCIGMDFGYTNDPTAIVRAYKGVDGTSIYLEELAYATGLTNDDISKILHDVKLTDREIVYADSAEPKSIHYIKQKGLNIKPTKKGRDSIMAGIDTLKRYKIYYKGMNLENEFHNYRWKEDVNGEPTNTPIDNYNHAIDAVRYATFNVLGKKKSSFKVI